MRQIKFRVWCKHCKEMKLDVLMLDSHGAHIKKGENHFVEWMQFTGLLDKNGKEIYEGDIVKWPNETMPLCFIRYDESKAWFCSSDKSLWFNLALRESAEDVKVEILGNIYENPELLS